MCVCLSVKVLFVPRGQTHVAQDGEGQKFLTHSWWDKHSTQRGKHFDAMQWEQNSYVGDAKGDYEEGVSEADFTVSEEGARI